MSATSAFGATAGLSNEDAIADLVTLNILKEELAVVENCIRTTPDTPFTVNRRKGLLEQKQKLLQMIAQLATPARNEENTYREERNISADGASSSSSLSPAPSTRLTLPLDRIKREDSVSGFSTPRSVKEEPFASTLEEPFVDIAEGHNYNAAQEFAYTPFPGDEALTLCGSNWEFAQQIAQLNSVDDLDDYAQLAELERQRQAQIEEYAPLTGPPFSLFHI